MIDTSFDPALESEQPWNYLLIDGVRLPDAEKRLYQLCDAPECRNLFRGTEWDTIADVGPLLIEAETSQPFVNEFLQDGLPGEWGYLIRSDLSLSDLTRHLQTFLTVQHPVGEPVILRFADPLIARALFGEAVSLAPMGAGISALALPDSVGRRWHYKEPPGSEFSDNGGTATLSETDLVLMARVDHRLTLRTMVSHMDQFFPDWCEENARENRAEVLGELLGRAQEAGYTSERSLTHWTNVFGYLGPDVSLDGLPHPIDDGLKTIPTGTGAEQMARDLALQARDMAHAESSTLTE